MLSPPFAGPASAIVVTAIAVAGLAWSECLLLAAAAVASHRLFLWRMDLSSPMDGWRAGVRCVFAGAADLLLAMVLVGVAVAGLSGLWPMTHEHEWAALAVVATTGVFVTVVQVDRARRRLEGYLWAGMGGGLALAAVGVNAGLGVLHCLFVACLGVLLGRAGWQLASESAGAFFRGGQRF